MKWKSVKKVVRVVTGVIFVIFLGLTLLGWLFG